MFDSQILRQALKRKRVTEALPAPFSATRVQKIQSDPLVSVHNDSHPENDGQAGLKQPT